MGNNRHLTLGTQQKQNSALLSNWELKVTAGEFLINLEAAKEYLVLLTFRFPHLLDISCAVLFFNMTRDEMIPAATNWFELLNGTS